MCEGNPALCRLCFKLVNPVMSNNQNTLDQNILRQVFFILIILSLGLLLFLELSFFLPAVLGSLTLYILMRERMHYLTETKKWSKPRAAWLLMVLSFLSYSIAIWNTWQIY